MVRSVTSRCTGAGWRPRPCASTGRSGTAPSARTGYGSGARAGGFGWGCRIALPRGFAVGASGQLRWTDFEGEWPPHTLPGERREDRTRTFSVSVHHRRFTIHGFSPELVLTNESRTTNAQLYDYRKNAAELRFVRQF